MSHHGYSIASISAALGTQLLAWSPYLQALAALVAVIAGAISIYKSLKKKSDG